MVNRGIPERVAMRMSGHKTRAISDWCHIVSPKDMENAIAMLERNQDAQNENVAKNVRTQEPAQETAQAN